MGKRGKINKTYHSISEFEKEFFPNAHKEKIKNEKEKEPGSFGSELAMEFIENIKRKLSK